MERPLITTAEGLVPHLSGVERDPFGQYEFVADPPCHASQSGRSFQFGDTPGGGVALGCWSPGCQGPGFVRRIEDRLGVRIQIRASDGGLTHSGGTGTSAGSLERRMAQLARPKYQSPERAQPEVLGPGVHATALGGEFRVKDLMDLPVWFPVEAKKAYRWNYRGQRKGFAHSEKAEHGGVSLARNGGVLRKRGQAPVELKAWRTHRELSEQMERAADTLRAALSQAGDADSPCPHDVMVIDLDVHTDIPGAEGWRDAVIEAFQAACCPVFRSSGGRGAHILLRLTEREIERQKRGRPAGYFRWPERGEVDGAHADLYPPGRRGLVVLGVERGLSGAGAESVIPALGYGEAVRLLKETTSTEKQDEWTIPPPDPMDQSIARYNADLDRLRNVLVGRGYSYFTACRLYRDMAAAGGEVCRLVLDLLPEISPDDAKSTW